VSFRHRHLNRDLPGSGPVPVEPPGEDGAAVSGGQPGGRLLAHFGLGGWFRARLAVPRNRRGHICQVEKLYLEPFCSQATLCQERKKCSLFRSYPFFPAVFNIKMGLCLKIVITEWPTFNHHSCFSPF
jgi:hypothetical protein